MQSDFKTRGISPIWLASYPRSGNTFLRILLETIFNWETYSLYQVEGEKMRDPSADALQKQVLLPSDWRQLLRPEGQGQRILLKTHDLPEDDRPAIYVVRDGRPCIQSYFNYHQDFAYEKPTLTEVICGACQFGSWSGHYRGWNPRKRPNTLFIQYEELVQKPETIIPHIASFIDAKPTGGKLPTFAELQSKYPSFFRKGQSTDYLKGWTDGQTSLFAILHGEVMRECGYDVPTVTSIGAEMVMDLVNSLERQHERYSRQAKSSYEMSQLLESFLGSDNSDESKRRYAVVSRNWWTNLGLALSLTKRHPLSKGR